MATQALAATQDIAEVESVVTLVIREQVVTLALAATQVSADTQDIAEVESVVTLVIRD